MKEKGQHRLGIDAGAQSIKMVFQNGGSQHRWRKEHKGEPMQAFEQMVREEGLEKHLSSAVAAGKYARLLSSKSSIPLVSPVSVLSGSLKKPGLSEIRYLVDIGSSALSLLEVRNGTLYRYETNSLCAAGTGAFLDQQMGRLNLTYQSVEEIPIIKVPPSIASRCSVFAKSDLIHRQQAGYSIPQLWNGLVKGLAHAAFSTLFRGVNVDSDVLIIGGLANNKVFLHFFESLLDGYKLVVPPNPDFFLSEALCSTYSRASCKNNGDDNKNTSQLFETPLRFLNRKQQTHRHYVDGFNNEVDVCHIPEGTIMEGYVGVDIGSTSTKLAVLDKSGRLVMGLYTRTDGMPIQAFQRLLKGLDSFYAGHSAELKICGLGTTGSGRKLTGAFAGADLIKNEITAHLKGAIKEFPGVKTIFEIGGQDSKYIAVEDGWMKDANMNYVCAAGTGSFLEEQAKNLGIGLDEISTICKNALPPYANHRCTVFMEQDASQLLAKGLNKSQVMASIIYAVCKNYLHRVVQHRPVKEPILFLGATAKNDGLVEAFEHILEKQVHTSPFSHLMGAIGMAELVREKNPQSSGFKGFDIKDLPLKLSESACKRCTNECTISRLATGEQKEVIAAWGYQCGREENEERLPQKSNMDAVKYINKNINNTLIPARPGGVVYVPKVLHYYSYNVFWQQFFHALGIALKPVSGDKHSLQHLTGKYTLTEYCYPAKVATGRTIQVLKNGMTPLFLPYHISDTHNPKTSRSYFCPLSQAFPSIMKSTLRIHAMETDVLLTPVIDYAKDDERNVSELMRALGKRFHLTKKQIRAAWKSALKAQSENEKNNQTYANKLTSSGEKPEKPVFVLLGRSYNLLDELLNLDLPGTISRYGYEVVPMDLLPVQREDLEEGYQDMYWSYGQKIVVAAQYILRHPAMYPVMLSNFNCGPDSFLLGVFEKEMKDKPSLILELDEHGGDGGYVTRLEAFFDRVESHFNRTNGAPPKETRLTTSLISRSMANAKVYIPPMHPVASRMMSAALRAYGINSVALKKEDETTYAMGNACVRGSECMPAASTIGAFLYQLRQEEQQGTLNGSPALFMPCADGPCRFGQYARLHERILQSAYPDATIISPNSDDHYGDITGPMRIHILKALIISDTIDKLTHRIRPYEHEKGLTDNIINGTIDLIEDALEKRVSVTSLLKQMYVDLVGIKKVAKPKPLVGVVGEIYVRNSPFSNAYLVRTIEACGGEAWVAPIMEWLHYTTRYEDVRTLKGYFKSAIQNRVVAYMENRYMGIFRDLLNMRREPSINRIRRSGKRLIPDSIEGESILTVGRAIEFMKQGTDLVVNVSPFGCMPGSISASVLRDVSLQYGVPAVSLFYDGEAGFEGILEAYIQRSKK